MKKFLVCLAVAAFIASASSASALVIDNGPVGPAGSDAFSGLYLGTWEGNISSSAADILILESQIEASTFWTLGDVTLTEYGRLEVDDSDPLTQSGGGFSMTATDDTFTFGTWETNTNPATYLSFYLVKTQNQYAAYYMDPALSEGDWTTWLHFDLNDNGRQAPKAYAISHLGGYNGSDTATLVPEPTTMLLLGIGLVGLAGEGVRRRRKQRAVDQG